MSYTVNSNLRQFREIDPEKLEDFVRSKPNTMGLWNLAYTFVSVGRAMNIDPIYILAHAIHESGWGRSSLAHIKHNLFGYGAEDDEPFNKGYSFPTKKNCIAYVMYKVANRYLTKPDMCLPKEKWTYGKFWGGDSTLAGMNMFYASDGQWAHKICQLMNQIEAFVIKE